MIGSSQVYKVAFGKNQSTEKKLKRMGFRSRRLFVGLFCGIFLTLSLMSPLLLRNAWEVDLYEDTPIPQPNTASNDFPIIIDGDNGWQAFRDAGNCTGTGNAGDPYILCDRVIDVGGNGACIRVGNSSAYFQILNCTVLNAGLTGAGIYLENVTNSLISGNNCTGNIYGILLMGNCVEILIEHNNCTGGNTGIGLAFNCSENTIQYNRAWGNTHGIVLQNNCTGNLVAFNHLFANTGKGLYALYNASFNTFDNNVIEGNGNEGILQGQSKNNTITMNCVESNTLDGIWLRESANNSIANNTFISNGKVGARVELESNNNTIMNNSIVENGEHGILLLTDCGNNTINQNNISQNTLNGVILEDGCKNNTLVGNLISYNDAGGANLSTSCEGNTFYANSFIQNELGNAKDSGSFNHWDNGTVGNLWSDYLGHDSDGDGIGDTPYTSGSNVTDNFPICTWDDVAPVITINEPLPYALFGKIPPAFNITVEEVNPDARWYSLDKGATNVSFSGDIGSILIDIWDGVPNGTVTLTFYANDTGNNIGNASVILEVDKLPPIIVVYEPRNRSVYWWDPPQYNVSVVDSHLDALWIEFVADNQTVVYRLANESGTIPQDIWDQIPLGVHRVRVYANDTLGNEVYTVLVITKMWGQAIPGFPIEWLSVIIIVFVGFIIRRKIKWINAP